MSLPALRTTQNLCYRRKASQRTARGENGETGAYTVQVEGVGLTGRVSVHGERDLDGRVGGEGVDTAVGEELGSRERATEDLEQDGDSRGREGVAVDVEVRAVEGEVQVERVVDATRLRRAGRGEVLEGHEVGLVQRKHTGRRVRRGLDLGGTGVTEDGRVDTAVSRGSTGVGDRADPVVVDVGGGVEL